MKKNMFFGYDPSAAEAMLGYVHGIEKNVTTRKYLNAATGYTYSVLKEEFETALDAVAKSMPEAFHHVYEWGPNYESRHALTGVRRARLWRVTSSQSGGTRDVSFAFMPSKIPVPVNPILLKPGGKRGRTVKEGVHIFVWKSQVMEYNLPVTIRPKLAKALAFVNSETEKINFRKEPFTFRPGRSSGTAGNFSNFFLAWWTVEAERIFDKKIVKKLERDVASDKNFNKVTRKFTKKEKQISVNATRAGGSSFAEGARLADRDMRVNQEQYIAAAAQRRWELYGDDD